MSDRQIPHLRDIFGVPFDGVQYSPRSRRRGGNPMGGYSMQGSTMTSPMEAPPCTRFTEQLRLSPPEPGTDPDSAVSVGSSGEEDNYRSHKKKHSGKGEGRRSRSRGNGGGDPENNNDDDAGGQGYTYSGTRTLTQRDVKHLERHLSMKKTIRKKIMRDLRQAFVEDPSEFRVDPARSSPDQLRQINLQNLNFGPDCTGDANFLEILRSEGGGGGGGMRGRDHKHQREEDRDSGHGSPTREQHNRYTSRSHNQVEEPAEEEGGKKSGGGFWKRFTLKGRSSKR